MPSSEYEEWVLFHQEEPFGAPWENLLAAWDMAIFAAAHTSKNKKPPGISEFMYRGPQAQKARQEARTKEFLMRLHSKAKK